MSKTTVTTKGQITIPKPIRDRKGIAPGTRMEVSEQGDEIILRKTEPSGRGDKRDVEFEEYLERVRGSMKLGMTTDEYMELLRGE